MNQVATAATSSNPASSNPASILENLKLSDAKANMRPVAATAAEAAAQPSRDRREMPGRMS
jgi:hypothetical protein